MPLGMLSSVCTSGVGPLSQRYRRPLIGIGVAGSTLQAAAYTDNKRATVESILSETS